MEKSRKLKTMKTAKITNIVKAKNYEKSQNQVRAKTRKSQNKAKTKMRPELRKGQNYEKGPKLQEKTNMKIRSKP